MNVPIPAVSGKVVPFIAAVAIFMMAAAYFVFLYSSWNAFERDRLARDEKINKALDLLKPKTEAE